MGFVSVKITIVLQEVNPYEYEIEARGDSDVNDVKHAQAEVTKATAIQTPPPKHFIGQSNYASPVKKSSDFIDSVEKNQRNGSDCNSNNAVYRYVQVKPTLCDDQLILYLQSFHDNIVL